MKLATPTFKNTPGTAIREDQYLIHAGVTGVSYPSTFSWTAKEGGDLTTENVYTRPGGMQPGVALGGPLTRSDVTVKRQYTTALDPWIGRLEAACGNARMWVSWTPLDANGTPNGKTHTLTGILKEVQVPNSDANTSAASFLGLVMACDQEAR